jgi:CheY-like chemotaxis protein
LLDKTLLIIDDNKEEINLCEIILNNHYTVLGATSAQEGISTATRESPDLILIDQKLGDRDGFEVCRNLIASPETRNIPIVMLAASLEDEAIQKASSLGVVDFIAKPIIPAYFSKRIQTIMERYSGWINRCGECFKPMQMDWSFCPYDGSRLPPLRQKTPPRS